MKKDIKQMWLNSIRFGNYLPITTNDYGLLRIQDRYCVLGILCDLFDKTVVRSLYSQEESECRSLWVLFNQDNGRYKYSDGIKFLPNSILTWSGLDSTNPTVKVDRSNIPIEILEVYGGYREMIPISVLVDVGIPYDKIADLIERDTNL